MIHDAFKRRMLETINDDSVIFVDEQMDIISHLPELFQEQIGMMILNILYIFSNIIGDFLDDRFFDVVNQIFIGIINVYLF